MEVNANFTENAKNDFQLVMKAREGSQKAYADLIMAMPEMVEWIAAAKAAGR